jgi:hypothetical protein
MPTGSLTVPGLGAAYALSGPFWQGTLNCPAKARPLSRLELLFGTQRKSAPSVSPNDFRFGANAGLGGIRRAVFVQAALQSYCYCGLPLSRFHWLQNGKCRSRLTPASTRTWRTALARSCDSFILAVGLPVLSTNPLIRTLVAAGNCFIRIAACSKSALLSDGTSALLVAK